MNIESDNISYQMVSAYLSQEDDVILGAEVSHYELALEMLYNLEQLKYAKIESEKMKKAKALFLNCKIPEAMPLLEDCSDDNFEARYMLSKIYEEGIDTEKNIDYAKELIRQNVSMGYCNSIVQAGFLEIIDWNDVAKYKDDLIAAANQGDVFAQYELALYYLNIPLMMGDHNPPDYERALNYFELSAAQGYFRAHHGIALRYYNGQGVEQEGRKAESYFKIAADMGYGKSMLYLGDIYFRGRLGIEKNKSEGIEWYKKAYEHGQCNDSSINRIAVSYSDDDGIGDNAEALKWWRIGAQRNFPSCLSNIGWAYRNGKGVSVDYQKAIEYYKKGIQAGAEDGYEENNLGDMYLNGYGVTADRTVARSWYEKAANKGNEKAKKWLENNPT